MRHPDQRVRPADGRLRREPEQRSDRDTLAFDWDFGDGSAHESTIACHAHL